MDRSQRETRASTRAGQVKTGGARHEKDDRHAIDDRTRYVLGWSNESKIRALTARRHGLEKRIQTAAEAIAGRYGQHRELCERLGNVRRIGMVEGLQRL